MARDPSHQIIDLKAGVPPFTVGSLGIFLYFTQCSLHFFHYAFGVLSEFSENPVASVLNSAFDRLTISISIIYFFWSFVMFFHLGHISFSPWFCSLPVLDFAASLY